MWRINLLLIVFKGWFSREYKAYKLLKFSTKIIPFKLFENNYKIDKILINFHSKLLFIKAWKKLEKLYEWNCDANKTSFQFALLSQNLSKVLKFIIKHFKSSFWFHKKSLFGVTWINFHNERVSNLFYHFLCIFRLIKFLSFSHTKKVVAIS